MSKKVKTTSLFNKNNIATILAALSFSGMVLLSIYTVSFTQYVNEQNEINAEQFYKIGIQSAQQQYCIENAVKPCTQDAINAHEESISKK